MSKYTAFIVVSFFAFLHLQSSGAEDLGTIRMVYECDFGSHQAFSVEPCSPGNEISSKEAIVYPSGVIEPIPSDSSAATVNSINDAESIAIGTAPVDLMVNNSEIQQNEVTLNGGKPLLAFCFAVIGVIITFIGFGLANKIESNFISTLTKVVALAIGFLSMPALESLIHIKGVSAAGGYWVYIMIGVWLLSKVFGRRGNVGK